MSLSGANAGYLDVRNAILRVGTLDVQTIVSGVDTATNIAKTNTILLWDDQGSDMNSPPFVLSSATRSTSPPYLDLDGGVAYAGIKLPNAWLGAFEVYMSDKTDGSIKLHTYTTDTTTYGDTGYELVLDNSGVTLNYDGTQLATESYTWTNDTWHQVVVGFERGAWTVSVDGTVVLVGDDDEREAVYANTGQYLRIDAADASTTKRVRYVKFAANGHWLQSNAGVLSYSQGKVAIGSTNVDDGALLQVHGGANVHALRIEKPTAYASLEMYGPSGSFIDMGAGLNSNDYDFRFITTGSDRLLLNARRPSDGVKRELLEVDQESGQCDFNTNVAVGTNDLFVDTNTGRVGIGTTLPSHSLTTPGRVRIGSALSFAESLSANHVKCMKYFASAGHWLVATGSYAGGAFQWLSVKAIAARLDTLPKEMSLNIRANGGFFNVRDVRIVGNNGNYNNELLVFKNTSDSTYYVYASIDSASTWTFDITHRASTIDEDGSTFTAGALDTTDLTVVSNTATYAAFSLINGNVGIGTTSSDKILTTWNGQISTSTTPVSFGARVLGSSSSHYSWLEVRKIPETDPVSWVDWSTRLQQRVDGTYQGYIEFNPPGGAYGLAFGMHNDEYMRIKNGGNIGIGTTDPLHTLDVSGNTYINDILFVDSDTNRVGIGTTYPSSPLHIQGAHNTLTQENATNDRVYSKSFVAFNEYGAVRYWKIVTGSYTGTPRNTFRMTLGFNRVDAGYAVRRLSIKADAGDLSFQPSIDEGDFLGTGWPSDLRVYKNTTDGTFDVYIKAESYYRIFVRIDHGPNLTVNDVPSWETSAPTTSGTYTLEYSNSNRAAIKIGNTGFVGIGTTTPTAPLHVRTTGSATNPGTKGIYVYNPNNSANEDATASLRVAGSSAGDPFLAFDVANEAGWAWGIDNSDGNKMKLGADWNSVSADTKLTIDRTGKVGINTSNPTSNLHVAGINTTWVADYESNAYNYGNTDFIGPATRLIVTIDDTFKPPAGVHDIVKKLVATGNDAYTFTTHYVYGCQVGDTVVVQHYARSTTGTFTECFIFCGSQVASSTRVVQNGGDWELLTYQFTITSAGNAAFRFDVNADTQNMYMTGVCVRKNPSSASLPFTPYQTPSVHNSSWLNAPNIYGGELAVISHAGEFRVGQNSEYNSERRILFCRNRQNSGSSDEGTEFYIGAAGEMLIARHSNKYYAKYATISTQFSSGYPHIRYRKIYGGDESWYVGMNNTGGGSSSSSDFKFLYGTTVKAYMDADGTDAVDLNFTGQHRTFIKDVPYTEADALEGLIVVADQNKYIKMSGGVESGSNAITTNESLPIVSLSNVACDKKCFGVVSSSEDPETRKEAYGNFVSVSNKELGDTRVYINSVGEGAMWVTNINGSLESGDYITTSNVAGYGQRQDDDILHNYTVAKITMDCDFNPPEIPKQRLVKELANVTYWVKLEDVTEEVWSNIATHEQRTEQLTYYTIDERHEVHGYIDEQSNVFVSPDYDVKLYTKTQENIVSEEVYNALPEDEQALYDSNTFTYTQLIEISPEVWNGLDVDEQNTYVLRYYNFQRIEVDADTSQAIERTRTLYKKVVEETKLKPEERLTDYLSEVREEWVNVLDEHGQLQFEDVPWGETEPAYRIRYLDADGQITTRHNEVYRAAFVGVTYHCG
jgi:hypothetical protein